MLLAGGSAIDGSEPILFMGLYNFFAADPITRQNWDVGSAKNTIFNTRLNISRYWRDLNNGFYFNKIPSL